MAPEVAQLSSAPDGIGGIVCYCALIYSPDRPIADPKIDMDRLSPLKIAEKLAKQMGITISKAFVEDGILR